eukprot:5700198-Lingulodinium_polyedra.AAC.1
MLAYANCASNGPAPGHASGQTRSMQTVMHKHNTQWPHSLPTLDSYHAFAHDRCSMPTSHC